MGNIQGTLKSLLQHHSSKAAILRHSAFFLVQLSHPYMTLLSYLLPCSSCNTPGADEMGIRSYQPLPKTSQGFPTTERRNGN